MTDSLVEDDEYEVYEGEDEDDPEDGEDTVGGVAPVEDGVDVGLVRHVSPARLCPGSWLRALLSEKVTLYLEILG